MFEFGVFPWADSAVEVVTMTVVTTSSPQTITLTRITPTGADCVVTWGDGNSTTISDGETGSTAHEYATAGTYQIALSNPEILTYIDVNSQPISALDVTLCTALTDLRCNSTSISALDVSNNTALTDLRCNSTSISALDVSNNTALTDLRCDNTSISALDVSNNTALKTLYCYSTPISTLDVSNNTALATLLCHFTSISALDVSNNTALTDLWCHSTSISALDVSNNTALTDLQYQDCGLTQAQHDAIIDSIWTMTQTRTPADGTGTINGGGTNTDPSGTYQAASVCPPTDKLERVYEMVNDSCAAGFNKWASFTY